MLLKVQATLANIPIIKKILNMNMEIMYGI
jgi:hypothetical protein